MFEAFQNGLQEVSINLHVVDHLAKSSTLNNTREQLTLIRAVVPHRFQGLYHGSVRVVTSVVNLPSKCCVGKNVGSKMVKRIKQQSARISQDGDSRCCFGYRF